MSSEPQRDTQSTIEQLFACYVDRLNDGERVREDQILAENPEHGPLLVEYLADYMGVVTEDDADRPLGTLGDYTLRRQIGRGGIGVPADESISPFRPHSRTSACTAREMPKSARYA